METVNDSGDWYLDIRPSEDAFMILLKIIMFPPIWGYTFPM